MVDEKEVERLKKDVGDLKKSKIIMQAKLKQKEDKITDLSKKVRQLSITSKESSGAKDSNNRIEELEAELNRSRKINKNLRSENASLINQLAEAKKTQASAPSPASASVPKLEKVSLSGETGAPAPSTGVDPEELQYLQNQLGRKDDVIARLTEQIDMMKPENLSQLGGSYMQTRKLNAKIRELKSMIELSKKSEASMKQRLMEMQRKSSMEKDFADNW